VFASDISTLALDAVAGQEGFDASITGLFQWDITREYSASPTASSSSWAPAVLPEQGVDVVLLTFVLSALSPGQMAEAIGHVVDVIRPGGYLCFRDYAIGDMKVAGEEGTGLAVKGALSDDVWLGGRCFRRDDGTLSYFFNAAEVHSLCVDAGLEAVPLQPAGWSAEACKAATSDDGEGVMAQYHTVGMRNRKTGDTMPRVMVSALFRKSK
jgi:methyltransferase-like protein 6